DSKESIKSCRVNGCLHNCQNPEGFKALDKSLLLRELSNKLWEDIRSGAAVEDPSLLQRFLIVSFADLKRHRFIYFAAFPALLPPKPFTWLLPPVNIGELSHAEGVLSPTTLASLNEAVTALHQHEALPPFFLIVSGKMVTLAKYSATLGGQDEGESGVTDKREEPIVAFLDPSGTEHPGWPLRSLLVLAYVRWDMTQVTVLALREVVSGVDRSTVMRLSLGDSPGPHFRPSHCGWETNASGSMVPRVVDFSALMDPIKLARQSCDLNLRLMTWRVLPDLDLEMMKSTQVLIIGAGTLGCNVARLLMGWGVCHITFIDAGLVSYSNPVRQNLFEQKDEGRSKAEAAAEALTRMCPASQPSRSASNSSLPVRWIPCPGKPCPNASADINQLDEMLQQSHVVFLLTDTRESRWLPTVMCQARDKLLITAALGTDTYLVMRHGAQSGGSSGHASGAEGEAGQRLGCYFCQDVVAPGAPSHDRAWDEQCTVTRPGAAPMAAALAVELMVAIAHHPARHRVSADANLKLDSPITRQERPFGALPHQIRGFLAHYAVTTPATQAFDCCSACSPAIVQMYRS
ncbi:unnamed protein product, partial [Chrysoparadoxa australica]